MHGKMKTKEYIKMNFHGQDVPQDMYCDETAVLSIDSMYINPVINPQGIC